MRRLIGRTLRWFLDAAKPPPVKFDISPERRREVLEKLKEISATSDGAAVALRRPCTNRPPEEVAAAVREAVAAGLAQLTEEVQRGGRLRKRLGGPSRPALQTRRS